MVQFRHFTLYGEIANHPVIFILYFVFFNDCVRQHSILYLRSQIQQFLYVRKFSYIVCISSCRAPAFQLLKDSDP